MGAATEVGVVGLGEAARRPGTILCDGTRADGDTMDTPPTQIPIDLARAEPLRKKKMEQNKSRIVMLPESARTISRRKSDRGEGVSIPYQQIETDPVLESPLERMLRWVGRGWRRSAEQGLKFRPKFRCFFRFRSAPAFGIPVFSSIFRFEFQKFKKNYK